VVIEVRRRRSSLFGSVGANLLGHYRGYTTVAATGLQSTVVVDDPILFCMDVVPPSIGLLLG